MSVVRYCAGYSTYLITYYLQIRLPVASWIGTEIRGSMRKLASPTFPTFVRCSASPTKSIEDYPSITFDVILLYY